MSWISVEEGLPEIQHNCWRTSLPVNVMIKNFGQYIAYPCVYGSGVFYWADALTFGNDIGAHPELCDRNTEVLSVTHWQPLPDPPEN